MQRVIIAGVDRSACSRAAAEWATREALLRGLPLRVVHVEPPAPLDPVEQWPYRPAAVADHVVAELVERHPALRVRGESHTGTPAPVLRAVAEKAELVVLGLRGEGGGAGNRVGATAAALAERADGPVVLVPGPHVGPPRTSAGVTVGVDVRDPLGGALDFAFEEARLRGARLHAVYGWRLPASAAASPFPVLEEDRATWEDHEVQLLSDVLRPWRTKYPDVDVLEDVVLFTPADALVHASEGAELVVLGRNSAPGATLRDLLERSRCPVAVVPA
ncbi:universal stress protein [Streptomyces guryensis]|uniref:Universal stress protein n=1 Tax=Streptomyces guryensis TaxID=2886947 RepID=A0A9Q3VU28_9ACTN|nr:universal stress protein [Streptomyces guryensis]MCD9877654.1 universal stress protein [Streptomyces guryensis]